MSEGNGHPYSWSAIFNGYSKEHMKDCPFPVILDYLAKQSFPSDSIKGAKVTHVWCQNNDLSQSIAKASNIDNVVDDMTDMIGQVDAILLARDDSENHYEMSKPFIEAGLPIFIDKPITTSLKELEKIWSLEQYEGQIFTCSSILFAKEFSLSRKNLENEIGKIKFAEATIPKSWEKYAVHIIEPLLNILGSSEVVESVKNTGNGKEINLTTVKFQSDIYALLKVLGTTSCPLRITFYGEKSYKELNFSDSFYAFKKSLEVFIEQIHLKKRLISKKDTRRVIEIIEKGYIK